MCKIYDAMKKWYLKWNIKPTANEILDSEWIAGRLSQQEIYQIKGVISLLQKSRELYNQTYLTFLH